jgi:hypothetical protein
VTSSKAASAASISGLRRGVWHAAAVRSIANAARPSASRWVNSQVRLTSSAGRTVVRGRGVVFCVVLSSMAPVRPCTVIASSGALPGNATIAYSKSKPQKYSTTVVTTFSVRVVLPRMPRTSTTWVSADSILRVVSRKKVQFSCAVSRIVTERVAAQARSCSTCAAVSPITSRLCTSAAVATRVTNSASRYLSS